MTEKKGRVTKGRVTEKMDLDEKGEGQKESKREGVTRLEYELM